MSKLKEINSGVWPDHYKNAQQVAAGMRQNPESFKGSMSDELIFVAITGRYGHYRTKTDVEKLCAQIPLDVEWEVVKIKNTNINVEAPFCVLGGDQDAHEKLFDTLVEHIDTVYPDPEGGRVDPEPKSKPKKKAEKPAPKKAKSAPFA